MNVCNLPNASLIITTMKVHFAVIVSMHFVFLLMKNGHSSFEKNTNLRGETWVRKGDLNV